MNFRGGWLAFNLFCIVMAFAGALAPEIAQANVGQEFGFGSRTAALGGAYVATGSSSEADAFVAFSNPGALAVGSEKRLTLGYGIINMNPSFEEIRSVVVANNYTSDQETISDVDTSYRATLGHVIGLRYLIDPELRMLSFGLVYYSPLNHFGYIDTGEILVPEYVLYRARTQRPQVEAAVGFAPWNDGWSFGAGAHLSYTLSGNASVFLNSTANSVSNMRIAASLKPKVAPYFGALYRQTDWHTGLVFRLPTSANAHYQINSGARIAGALASMDFIMSAHSTLYYDPMTLELGGSYAYSPTTRILAQLDYQFWGDFEPPAISIPDPTITGTPNPSGVDLSPGATPPALYRNVLIPRIGHEWEIGKVTLRLGYAFRDSIVKSSLAETGNYLDPPKHMLNIGTGWKFNRLLGMERPYRLDLHASFHWLQEQTVVKTPGDERNFGTGNKIGSPGYKAGGKIFGGGVSLSLEL